MTAWRLRPGPAAALALLLLASIAGAAEQRLIHSEKSLYREVFVYEDGNTRCLCFTRLCAIGRQTCVDLRQPNRLVFEYTQMMLGALYLNPDPHSILIIGLGGGMIIVKGRPICTEAVRRFAAISRLSDTASRWAAR